MKPLTGGGRTHIERLEHLHDVIPLCLSPILHPTFERSASETGISSGTEAAQHSFQVTQSWSRVKHAFTPPVGCVSFVI